MNLFCRWLAFLSVVILPVVSGYAAASFTIRSATTSAQNLGIGQTGVVTAAGTLTVAGSTVAITVSSNSATLTNDGTISQTGTGRGIFDSAGSGLVLTNGSATNAAALIQTADADVVRVNVGGVTLNNYGTLNSLNASAGGSQAVDFNPIVSGSNIVNNFATGRMQASQADAVRPGVGGVVYNAGLIKSTTTNGSSSDGVDAQTNTGIRITNDTTGLIEGARHGITGGALDNTVNFTTSITNNLGGIIQGDNGSGINLDGFDAKQTATIVNHGTITGNGHDLGNGTDHDGDGVDVDGLVNVINTGVIRSINAFSASASVLAFSEGITVGGGTITNSGTIEGLVAVGNTNAVGRGISLVGNDIVTGTLSGTREAIYGNVTVLNQSGGLIRGLSDSGIFVGGPASGFVVMINNQAGGTIEGGGATAAAIQLGADNATLINAGTIIADASGKAVDLGSGNDQFIIQGGSITGDISGGTGTSSLSFALGSSGTFSYTGGISKFAGGVQVSSGTLILNGSIAADSAVTVASTGVLSGGGHIGGVTTIAGGGHLAPGDGVGTLTLSNGLTLASGAILDFQLGTMSDRLLLTGGTLTGPAGFGGLTLNLADAGGFVPGTYTLFDFVTGGTLTSSFDATDFAFGTLIAGTTPGDYSIALVGNTLVLTVAGAAIPEPATDAAICGVLALAGTLLRRRSARTV